MWEGGVGGIGGGMVGVSEGMVWSRVERKRMQVSRILIMASHYSLNGVRSKGSRQ